MKSLLINRINVQIINRNKLLQVFLFSLIFGLVKVNSVLSVFILANFSATIEIFGSVDYALALGIIIGVPLNVGLPGAYPYFVLKLKQKSYESSFYFHSWALSFLFILIQSCLIFFNSGLSITFQLTMIIAAIFCLQIMASVMFKSKEKLFTALMFEAGFFIILNLYNLYLFYTGGNVDVVILKNCFFGYLIFLNIYFLIRLILSPSLKWTAYKQVLNFGMPLVAGSLLIIALTGSARIIIERWISMEAVGIYGLYFRLAAIVVMLHQIVNIAFFKKIYTSDPKTLDKWFAYFLAFILMVSLLAFGLIPLIVMPYVNILSTTWGDYQGVYCTLSFQMFFWIALALFENIIYREKLSVKCNPGLIFLFTLMIATIFLIKYFVGLSLMVLVIINALTIYLSGEWQIYLLTKANLKFNKTKYLLRLTALLLIIYSTFQLL